jgi:hypothetical protein
MNNGSPNEKETPEMKMRTKTALARFGGVAALVLAVAVVLLAAVAPSAPSARVTPGPALRGPAAVAAPPDAAAPGGTGVHTGILIGCIGGLNC